MRLIDAQLAVVTLGVARWAAAVYDVPIIGARQLQHQVVPCAGAHRQILFVHPNYPLDKAKRRVAHGVGQRVGGTCRLDFRPHGVLLALPPKHVGPSIYSSGVMERKVLTLTKGTEPVMSSLSRAKLKWALPPFTR